jgi:hypothetical protein
LAEQAPDRAISQRWAKGFIAGRSMFVGRLFVVHAAPHRLVGQVDEFVAQVDEFVG